MTSVVIASLSGLVLFVLLTKLIKIGPFGDKLFSHLRDVSTNASPHQ